MIKMNKENLKIQYNVDADKVKWRECENRGYKWETSDISTKGYYINKEGNDYTVVDAKTNSVCKSVHDLSALEEERKMRTEKAVVTDGIALWTWNRDELKEKIYEFNNEHEKKMLIDNAFSANGFSCFGLGFYGVGLELLKQFCKGNNVKLVQVPPVSVDMHNCLDKLMEAAEIK